MPFDGLPSENIYDLMEEARKVPVGLARAKILIKLLRHAEFEDAWPWDYNHTTTCAIGLCDFLWRTGDVSRTTAYKIGMTQQHAHLTFRCLGIQNITPHSVANCIENGLES